MKFTSAALAAVYASTVYCHATITSVLVNGVDQGLTAPVHGLATTPGQGAQGYIRVPWNNDPVKDITSPSLTCNTNNTEAPVYVAVNGGDKLTMQWHHDSVSASDDIIDATHVGPIITYMAPSGTGAGTVWVKIAQSGYDNSAKKWAVTTLIANKGKSDITVPSALAPGKYLVRQEIIALHEADTAYSSNPKRGAQLYISCVQITIGTGGSTNLPAGVAIPGVYKTSDVIFDLKKGKPETFNIPGPALWNQATGGGTAAPPGSDTTGATKATSGTGPSRSKTKKKMVSSVRFRRETLD